MYLHGDADVRPLLFYLLCEVVRSVLYILRVYDGEFGFCASLRGPCFRSYLMLLSVCYDMLFQHADFTWAVKMCASPGSRACASGCRIALLTLLQKQSQDTGNPR